MTSYEIHFGRNGEGIFSFPLLISIIHCYKSAEECDISDEAAQSVS
jgi:hypothetical protein